MPPRLLSLLSSVESALINQGWPGVNTPPQRAVNYQKGIARMIFSDGSGSVTLQNFVLADGQICVRAQFTWAPSQATASCSIYPTGNEYNWNTAAEKIADGWVNGQAAAAAAAAVQAEQRAPRRTGETQSGLERLVAAS